MTVFRPSDAAETVQVVSWAAAEHQTLEIVAGGSKRGLGRPAAADHTLDLSAISGIVDYDPAELVLTARAATPMAVIGEQLDTQGQILAFEPPDWAALLPGRGPSIVGASTVSASTGGASTGGGSTLGGVIACNLAGPRRVRAGAARDHFLGFNAVNGWGDAWKSGGTVVKNVTGYDMCKLQAGAYGTLSALMEVSVRVLPRPETTCSVVVPGLTGVAAMQAMSDALNSPHEVSAAAHLPALAAARSSIPGVAGARGGVTVLRLEGHRPSVNYRAAELEAGRAGAIRLDEADSIRLWREIAKVQPLMSRLDSVVWRVCPTPSAATAVMDAVRRSFDSAQGFYDWGGGLLWLEIDLAEAGLDAGAAAVRGAVAAAGGHATLLRAPDDLRARVPVFEPAPAALVALTQRVKNSFDPNGVLNPGRMHEGV